MPGTGTSWFSGKHPEPRMKSACGMRPAVAVEVMLPGVWSADRESGAEG